MPARLDNFTAIVTGGADGIGRAITELFCQQGARVIIADINPALGLPLADQLQSKEQKALFIETDIADKLSVEEMARQVENQFGAAQILVNNAGIIPVTPEPLDAPDELWKRMFAINLDGMWNCTRAVLPGMKAARKGSIVNVGSVHAYNIVRGHFPYAVTKHAVTGLTRNLAVEYGKFNIRVNVLSPGMIETPTAFDVWAQTGNMEEARSAIGSLHPLGRNGTTDEIAYPALFLASDEAAFITGQSLIVDGGRSIVYHD